ncbi:hypothetical protein MKW98_029197 [Papaver atlanticum]|uniref:Bet v I/Major latex protein domain-containing protein n=1 Tax=Papaver atlanticum TaxID=357466 RepID=A0AAD4XME9_9MAGN|nr:hypothetical protein MKW98_029197 [Papaver atlanticum]
MTETHVKVEVKAKCSAKKLFSVMTGGASKLSKYAPKTVQNVQVLPGDSEIRVGSVFVWDYILDGSAVMAKEELTAVDHKNIRLTVTPTQRDGNHNCLVKWSFNEKANEDVPDPTYINKWVEDFIKELDTNLLKEAE